MTHIEWLEGIGTKPSEQIFRIARGCQNCAYYLPETDKAFVCTRPDLEEICRKEHEEWLYGEMDI